MKNKFLRKGAQTSNQENAKAAGLLQICHYNLNRGKINKTKTLI